jgi:hypothetical protein
MLKIRLNEKNVKDENGEMREWMNEKLVMKYNI